MFYIRRDSGIAKMLGSMTKLLGKNIIRSTDILFLKTLTGSNSIIKHKKIAEVSSLLLFLNNFLNDNLGHNCTTVILTCNP